jgi:hypothetical protein
MTNPNDVQIGGSHYRNANIKIQPWDIVVANQLDYFQGNILKYLMRWKTKNGLEDLYKAKHFLEKYIEVNTNENQ